MERTGEQHECARCGKAIRWGLVYCVVCGAEIGENMSRAEKAFAMRSLRRPGITWGPRGD